MWNGILMETAKWPVLISFLFQVWLCFESVHLLKHDGTEHYIGQSLSLYYLKNNLCPIYTHTQIFLCACIRLHVQWLIGHIVFDISNGYCIPFSFNWPGHTPPLTCVSRFHLTGIPSTPSYLLSRLFIQCFWTQRTQKRSNWHILYASLCVTRERRRLCHKGDLPSVFTTSRWIVCKQ